MLKVERPFGSGKRCKDKIMKRLLGEGGLEEQ